MNRYELAKLLEWAGDLRTRKRLQKLVYLLQAAGCPLDADYSLHHYGPYSYDVAQLADEMVQVGLVEEEANCNVVVGQSFSYRLSERAREQLARLEREPKRRQGLGELEKFEALARQLLGEPSLARLEYAATIAYFRKQGNSWEKARSAAARFKNQDTDSPPMRNAEDLARKVLEPKEGD